MNDMTYKPLCADCMDDGMDTLATEKRWDDDLCSDCAQNRDEDAYERSLSDFYGGGGPVTVNEFCARAAADKARGR